MRPCTRWCRHLHVKLLIQAIDCFLARQTVWRRSVPPLYSVCVHHGRYHLLMPSMNLLRSRALSPSSDQSQQMYTNFGWQGLFDGFLPTLTYGVLARMLGEGLKSQACRLIPYEGMKGKGPLPFPARLLCIATAASTLQPLLTLATVQRIAHAPVADCARRIYEKSGWLGFYSGCFATFTYVVVSQYAYLGMFTLHQKIHHILSLSNTPKLKSQKIAAYVTFPE